MTRDVLQLAALVVLAAALFSPMAAGSSPFALKVMLIVLFGGIALAGALLVISSLFPKDRY